MAQKSSRHTVSTDLTRVLLRYFSKAGTEPSLICDRAKIDPQVALDPEARITGAQFESIWNVAVQEAGDENFGLHFARELASSWPGGNILFNIMMNCSTVGDAIEKFLRYHDIMADAIRPKMNVDNDLVHFSWEYFGPEFKLPSKLGETLLCLYLHMLRRVTDDNLDLVEVRVTSPRPMDPELYKKIFGTRLLFEQPKDELIVKKEFLDLPIFLADPGLLQALEQFAQGLLKQLFAKNELSNKVGILLGKLLVRGEKTGVEIVAKRLAMSVRSLQGKLKEEGTSYQQMLDEVRKRVAISYLKKPDVSIFEVAFLLGYSDQSAFNHAFKRWTGRTPREFRRT
jgi:AraC-like DNA-binding protein